MRSHDGMTYNKKAVISPNIRVNCCSRSLLRFDGSNADSITSLIYTNPCNRILNTSITDDYQLLLLFTTYAVANMRLLALARWRRVRRTQLVQNMTRKNAYTVVTIGSIMTSVPVAATAVRTGRGSVANLGNRPV